jgi:hypothetical protein
MAASYQMPGGLVAIKKSKMARGFCVQSLNFYLPVGRWFMPEFCFPLTQRLS